MKFIPGTKFKNNTSKNTRFFKKGQIYILNSIRPKDGKVIYTFKVGRELQEVNFESIEQAEEWLQYIVI